ncbi:MAG: hypothetical protein A2X28_02025 [Elusimicrobia bacterium GWA2_56_46]|nr:MAG: hypothetical protein A2X28_02025 [Elusimicrobia bacterium GWA2_56_46]OGR55452.1 MAG: hypothetical protein A2X39_00940 [Elusimicrobia bacterium GWC2_56_31]HBW21919.1 hypothetical protein [Elusimicrobiota bacterium]
MDSKQLVDILRESSDLVSKLGDIRLSDNRKLSSVLDIDGIQFWDAIAVEVALYHLPRVLDPTKKNWLFARKALSMFRTAVSGMRSRLLLRGTLSDHKNWPKRPIVFLGFTDYIYRDVLKPVVERMKTRGDIRICAIHSDRGRKKSDGRMSIWDYLDDGVKLRADTVRRQLCSIKKLLTADDVSRALSSTQYGHEAKRIYGLLEWILGDRLPALVEEALIAKNVVVDLRPQLIVSPDVADFRTRVYLLFGKRRGIPLLDVQFGAYADEAVEWRFFLADRVAVWGKESMRVLATHGVPYGQMSITGSPKHDGLFRYSTDDIQRTRVRLGVRKDQTMVVFASTHFGNEKEEQDIYNSLEKSIFKAASQTPGMYLVVKPHPLLSMNKTRNLEKGGKSIVFVDPKENITDLIAASDAVVLVGSTATFDSLIANKLTICPAFLGWTWNKAYEDTGAVLVPRTEDELVKVFKAVCSAESRDILNDLAPARQSLLDKHIYMPDGQAAARIESIALQMAGNHLNQ